MNLVSLATQKNLPLRQFMDIDTIKWIEINNPFKGISDHQFPIISSEDIELAVKYIAPLEWLLEPSLSETIHGVRHLMRVVIYSILLTKNIDSANPDSKNLITASILHDIRREHDKEDAEHGERAAKWFLENVDMIGRHFGVLYSEKDREEVAFAIRYHNRDYSEFECGVEYSKFHNIIDLLKIADALDRYRLPKLKWWPNQTLFRRDVPKNFMIFSYNLVLKSELAFMRNTDGLKAVINSISKHVI